MTIGEARKAYYGQYQKFSNAAADIAKEKEELDKKAKLYPNDQASFSEQAASLELTYTTLTKQAEAYREDLDKVIEAECLYANMKSTEQ